VLAKTIGESCDLKEWTSLLEPQTKERGRGKSLSTAVTDVRATPVNVDENMKKELVTILLKVYMCSRYMSRFVTMASMLSFSKQWAVNRQGF
jgi:hypothetical protein